MCMCWDVWLDLTYRLRFKEKKIDILAKLYFFSKKCKAKRFRVVDHRSTKGMKRLQRVESHKLTILMMPDDIAHTSGRIKYVWKEIFFIAHTRYPLWFYISHIHTYYDSDYYHASIMQHYGICL